MKIVFRKIINMFFLVIKRFIFSFVVIYAFNFFSISMNVIIPMNIFNILLVMILGFPSIIGFAVFSLVI